MAYTPFAVMAALAVITVSFQVSEPLQKDIPESNELKSIESVVESTTISYSSYSLQNLAEVAKSRPVENLSDAMANLTARGGYNSISQPHSLDVFASGMEKYSSSMMNVSIEVKDASIENLTVEVYAKTSVEFSSMEKIYNTSVDYYLEDVDDPLLSNIGYNSTITKCGYRSLAEKAGTGSNVSGVARGFPEVNPSSLTPSSREILITDDVTRYASSSVQNYAGYVSVVNPSNPGNYNSNHVAGTSNITSFESGQMVLISDQATKPGYWKTNVHRTIENNCYISVPLESAPSVSDRFENSSRGSSSNGVLTVLNASEVGQSSSESNIGFERVERPSDLVGISGITTGDGITKSYFRMNRSTARSTGLGPLIN